MPLDCCKFLLPCCRESKRSLFVNAPSVCCSRWQYHKLLVIEIEKDFFEGERSVLNQRVGTDRETPSKQNDTFSKAYKLWEKRQSVNISDRRDHRRIRRENELDEMSSVALPVCRQAARSTESSLLLPEPNGNLRRCSRPQTNVFTLGCILRWLNSEIETKRLLKFIGP